MKHLSRSKLLLYYLGRIRTKDVSDIPRLIRRSPRYLRQILTREIGPIDLLPDSSAKQSLQAMIRAGLEGNFEIYEAAIAQVLSSLEEITLVPDGSDISRSELINAINLLNSFSGDLHLTNRYLLNSRGLIHENAETPSRAANVAVRLHELVDISFQKQIRSIEEWLFIGNVEFLRATNKLANSINYIVREALTFNHLEAIETNLVAGMSSRPATLISIASFSRLPFYNRSSNLLRAIEGAMEEMKLTLANSDLTTGDIIRINKNSSVMNNHIIPVYERARAFMSFADWQAIKPPVDFTQNRRNFEDKFIYGITPLHSQSDAIVSIRRYISERNVQSILTRLDQLLEQSSLSVNLSVEPTALARNIEAREMRREIKVIVDYREATKRLTDFGLINKKVSDKPNRRILLMVFDQDRVSPLYVLPFVPYLQENGYSIYNLCDDAFCTDAVPLWPFSPQLSPDLRDVLGLSLAPDQLLNEWNICPEQSIISCNGVNYFQGIYERVGRVFKRYTLDWSLPSVDAYVSMWVLQIDRLVYSLDRVRTYCHEHDHRVTLFSLQSHFTPYFALKAYAWTHPTIFEHVTLSSSYENWATNVSGQPLSTVTLQNNNHDPWPSAPAFGTRSQFENWYTEVFSTNEENYVESAAKLVSVERSGVPTDQVLEVKSRIQEQLRGPGSRVFCMLGKIPYDLAVPTQGGPAHTDMKDWINHTISCIKKSPNLLLIKPHPHELSTEIANRGNESWLDLIEQEIDNSIVVLPHRGVNLQNIVDDVDTFLVWNGSSIAELGSQGAQVVAADEWASRNYPLNVFLPRDRAHYERIIFGENVEMDPDFRKRSIAYLNFLVDAPFSMKFPFTGRSSTNVNFNRAWFEWDRLSKECLRDFYREHDSLLYDVFFGDIIHEEHDINYYLQRVGQSLVSSS
jgi:hypothetical protein